MKPNSNIVIIKTALQGLAMCLTVLLLFACICVDIRGRLSSLFSGETTYGMV